MEKPDIDLVRFLNDLKANGPLKVYSEDDIPSVAHEGVRRGVVEIIDTPDWLGDYYIIRPVDRRRPLKATGLINVLLGRWLGAVRGVR